MKLHQNIKGLALALLLMGAGASMAGIAWAANGFVIFGAGGDAATVTNHKLDVNANATLSAAAVGHGTAATALRMELPTDGTGVVGLNAGANVIGKTSTDTTTPDVTNLVSTKISVANFVSGTATQTSTTSTSLVGLVAAKSLYITSWNCYNSGATASTILFQDGSGGTTLAQTFNPAGSGSNSPGGGILFKTTAGNALFFAPGSASTTQACSAAGFSQ